MPADPTPLPARENEQNSYEGIYKSPSEMQEARFSRETQLAPFVDLFQHAPFDDERAARASFRLHF